MTQKPYVCKPSMKTPDPDEIVEGVADELIRKTLSLADGAGIDHGAVDQIHESKRSIRVNVKGKPVKVQIVVTEDE